MSFAIDLKIDDKKVQKWLKSMEKNWDSIEKKTSPFVDGVLGVFVFQDVISHFEKEQGSGGGWKAWSKIYAEHMAKRGKGGNKILQDSGRLRQSFQAGQWRKKPGAVEWYNPAKTKGGFPYAAAHDEGGPKLPKRDFMWLSNTAMKKIAEACAKFMAGD